MDFLAIVKDSLSLPLPPSSIRKNLLEASFLGFFTALFLVVFQPFGTYEDEFPNKIPLLLGYGGVVFIALFPFKHLLFLVFPKPLLFWQALLGFIVLIVWTILCCFLYYKQMIYPGIGWHAFPSFFMYSSSVTILPLGMIMYGKLMRAKRVQRLSVAELTENIKETVILLGTNQTEEFHFNLHDILYLQSSGNYVEVFFWKGESVQSTLIRNTLSKIKAQLPAKDFTAVHRSYVVNRKHFSRLKKDQGKVWLVSDRSKVEVSVSRTYQAVAEQIVKDFR